MNELTKLDVFAKSALQAIFSNATISNYLLETEESLKNIAIDAYDIAEAMLAESEKRNKKDKTKREIPEIDKNDLTDLTK